MVMMHSIFSTKQNLDNWKHLKYCIRHRFYFIKTNKQYSSLFYIDAQLLIAFVIYQMQKKKCSRPQMLVA